MSVTDPAILVHQKDGWLEHCQGRQQASAQGDNSIKLGDPGAFVTEDRVRRAVHGHVRGDKPWPVRNHDQHLAVQGFELGVVLAQLRQMAVAVNSDEPQVEDQQGVLLAKDFGQRHRPPGVIRQGEIRGRIACL